jgi:hypothetical protein
MGALTRFWIVFETSKVPTPINLGCGVTARNLDDARELLRTRVFGGTLPREVGVIEDVPVASLDARNVRPAMGPVDKRGVWYPVPAASLRTRRIVATAAAAVLAVAAALVTRAALPSGATR